MTEEFAYRRPLSDPMRLIVLPLAVALLAVIIIDMTTSTMDGEAFKWDWVQYHALAEHGFDAEPLVSPFAYRYATPFLARALHSAAGIPIRSSFRILAYIGAVLQLYCAFLFVLWIAQSRRGAWSGMLIVLFSMMHVKFLLYDVYRPEHFAYGFMLLGTWLAFRRRLIALLVVTAIGLQFREFAGVPLAAYVLALIFDQEWKPFMQALLGSLAVFLAAVVLPRVLISVDGYHEYLALSGDGWLAPLTVLLNAKRDMNVLYAAAIYTAPVLFLTSALGLGALRKAVAGLPAMHRRMLIAYTLLVMVLTLYGGTDLARFVPYLVVPVLVVSGLLIRKAHPVLVVYVLAAVLVLNRMWIPIPDSDQHAYNEFLRTFGHNDWMRLNMLYRVLELALLTAGAWVLGRYLGREERAGG